MVRNTNSSFKETLDRGQPKIIKLQIFMGYGGKRLKNIRGELAEFNVLISHFKLFKSNKKVSNVSI